MSANSRRGLIIVLALVVLALLVLLYLKGPGPLAFAGRAATYGGASPSGVPAELAQQDEVTRGRYLALAADCQACHTAEGGALFAGGRPFKTPFGTLYAPNITPDRDTGIGTWSEAAFLRAVHEGVRPDGARLYPAFPYAAYTYLSDEDVRAIRAYLLTVPAVRNLSPPNSLAFPFNQRSLMAIWGLLYNPNQRFTPNGAQSPQWNRGAYLAEALAHCGDCHTPRNLLQGLNNRRKFAGALTAGWKAYNITPDSASGIGAWSDEQIADYLSNGHAAAHGSAGGPMGEAVQLSLSQLTRDDIQALVTYVRSVPAHHSALPAVRTTQAATTVADSVVENGHGLGREIFEGACASCHGWTGISPVQSRADLIGSRAINDPSAVNVAQMIISGSASPGIDGAAAMPGFGAAYSDSEIAAVANYVTARFGAKPSSITAREVARMRAGS